MEHLQNVQNHTMKQQLHFITLGVNNLNAMKEWYQENFGWTLMSEMEGIAFFKMNGCIFSLFPADELAKDIGIPGDGTGFRKFSLAVNFRSEKEIDDIVSELKEKGVRIVKEPQKVFWGGYHAYIADPENNYWELAYNPFLEMDAEGNVTSHQ
jgi:hypothetical protein